MHAYGYPQHGSKGNQICTDMSIGKGTVIGPPVGHDRIYILESPFTCQPWNEPGSWPGGICPFIQDAMHFPRPFDADVGVVGQALVAVVEGEQTQFLHGAVGLRPGRQILAEAVPAGSSFRDIPEFAEGGEIGVLPAAGSIFLMLVFLRLSEAYKSWWSSHRPAQPPGVSLFQRASIWRVDRPGACCAVGFSRPSGARHSRSNEPQIRITGYP